MSYEDMTRKELMEDLFVLQNRAMELNKELCEILDMDWIWLSKKPLDALLKWQDKFEIMILGEEL